MSTIHFLNVLEGDCNIIKHDSGRITVMDVSNAYNDIDTDEEKKVKASEERKNRRLRTQVPSDKKDYKQKLTPDNPISYLKKIVKTKDIFRFIISHPDMDHLDGIKDLYEDFKVYNTWDTDNKKEIDLKNFFAGYNKEDWIFYKNLRDGKYTNTKRLTYFDSDNCQYWNEDYLKILSPTPELIKNAVENDDYNDSSYALLFTPPKKDGKCWKIIFAGDTHDESWKHIIKKYETEVTNVDVLIAPHHGRDSKRDFTFLNKLTPSLTLLGNASSEHLAYSSYPKTRITNNQAGYVILDINLDRILVLVKNYEFARDFKAKRKWEVPFKYDNLEAFSIIQFSA